MGAKHILILGGAGVQNSYDVKELSNADHKVRILSRDPSGEGPAELAALSNVEVMKGDTYDESTLVSAFSGIEAVYVNTNGFAIGEKSEIYWGIRIYEIAYWSGVKHFIYSSLPYVSKKGALIRSTVSQFLKAQPTDKMNWSILESGPYADSFLIESWCPRRDDNGVYVFEMGIEEGGHLPFVSLADLVWFARYMFEHPQEFQADLLRVGIEHASGQQVADAFTAVTGQAARFQPVSSETVKQKLPETKLGTAHSPGYDDPTLVTHRQMFLPWLNIWSESGNNTGLWTRDYHRLDKIKPDRLRSVEQWMRSVNYDAEAGPRKVLRTGLTSG